MGSSNINLGILETLFSFLGIEYTLYSVYITTLTVFVTIMQMIKHWVFAQGHYKLTYWLNLVGLTGFTLLSISISIHSPSEKSLILLGIMNGWGIYQNIKGLLRLKEEEKNKD